MVNDNGNAIEEKKGVWGKKKQRRSLWEMLQVWSRQSSITGYEKKNRFACLASW